MYYDTLYIYTNDFYLNFSFNQNKNNLNSSLTEYENFNNMYIVADFFYEKNIYDDLTIDDLIN